MINIRYTSLYIIADKNCISAGWIIPGHVAESCGNEINFAECRCKFYFCRAWLPSPLPPLLQTKISLWIFLPFRPISNPPPCFLINFHAAPKRYLAIIGPRWIFTTIELFVSGDTCIIREEGGFGCREMVLIGSRIANESLKLALVTRCSKGDVSWSDEVCVRVLLARCVIVVTIFSSCDPTQRRSN